jgi:hypothetical protein
MPTATISPAVIEWRARYNAFRNAKRSIARGDDAPALAELAGPHRDYVQRRLAGLAVDDERIASVLASAAPHVRESAPPSFQGSRHAARGAEARTFACSLEDRLRFAAVPDYWPTSHGIAARMVQVAGLVAGEHVLEPSAGAGRLVEAILQHDPFVNVHACELAIPCREVLVVKQRYLTFDLVGSDFLHLSGGRAYDAILMHPPAMHAAPHVVKAFARHLGAGGRLVAIVPDAVVYAGDRKSQTLKRLIDDHADEPDGELIPGGVGESPVLPARLYVLRRHG